MNATFRFLSGVLPALAFIVIVLGAYVRLTDAGLGCPDWPGCYGRLTVPSQHADVHLDAPEWRERPLEAGKAWREMTHRYVASALGLGIVVMALTARNVVRRGDSNVVVYALVPLVVFQGLLGMWTVTLLLKPLVVSAHLLGGLATLALLWWNFLGAKTWARPTDDHHVLRKAAWATLVIIVVQVFLGAWTSANYAALACTDFPQCQGQWWPQTDFVEAFVLWRGLGVDYEFGVLETPARTAIHLVHRLGAVATTAVILSLIVLVLQSGAQRLRRVAWCILAALICQLTLGISNVVGGLPLAVAVAHNAGAAVLSMSVITLLYLTRRI